MFEGIPIWVILIDYMMGLVMWTLVGRFGMSIFVSEQSDFFFMKAFVRMTDPMIKAMAKLTPGFLVDRLRPLYVAWFIFMIRFYIMPVVLGYDVMGMLSFPLESELALIIYDIGQIFRRRSQWLLSQSMLAGRMSVSRLSATTVCCITPVFSAATILRSRTHFPPICRPSMRK